MGFKLNWRRVLDSAGIEYVERGANVKRGEINIQCPFCGKADPSHHMGLNLEKGYWACWRNQSHRGKSPVRLLMKLLHCSYERAREIAGLDADYIDPEGFDAVAARIMSSGNIQRMEEVRRDFLALPEKEISPLHGYGRTRRHWDYLVYDRGFLPEDIELLTRWYGVCAATSGRYADRILLPYIVNGELVAWTGRAIADARIRYLDLPKDECLIEPKKTLFNHDALIGGGKALVVVEGPFDTLKLDLYGRDWSVRSVAISTNSISDDQIYLLEEAAYKFDQVLMMMDNASRLGVVDSMRLKDRVSTIPKLHITPVPSGRKDGGELTPTQVINYARRITTCLNTMA